MVRAKLSILNQSYPNNVYDWNPEIGYKNLQYEDYIPKKPLGKYNPVWAWAVKS